MSFAHFPRIAFNAVFNPCASSVVGMSSRRTFEFLPSNAIEVKWTLIRFVVLHNRARRTEISILTVSALLGKSFFSAILPFRTWQTVQQTCVSLHVAECTKWTLLNRNHETFLIAVIPSWTFLNFDYI